MLAGDAPIVAATDYVRAYSQLISEYVDARFITLGTDDFGRSDTRAALRRFFGVDRDAIVTAAKAAFGL
jgi:pyruvate dehydrogenase E1 component